MTLPSFALPYSVSAAKVATFSFATYAYGTPVSLNYLQSISFSPQHDTDQLMNMGAVERMLSVLKSVNVGLKMGGLDWTGLAVMTGMANADSGSGANEEKRNELEGGGSGLPYFGAALQLDTDDGTVEHLYIPLLKMDSYPEISPEMNKFMIPELKATAGRLRLAAGTTKKIASILTRPAGTALPTSFATAFGVS
jgi:hypothetical protein